MFVVLIVRGISTSTSTFYLQDNISKFIENLKEVYGKQQKQEEPRCFFLGYQSDLSLQESCCAGAIVPAATRRVGQMKEGRWSVPRNAVSCFLFTCSF